MVFMDNKKCSRDHEAIKADPAEFWLMLTNHHLQFGIAGGVLEIGTCPLCKSTLSRVIREDGAL